MTDAGQKYKDMPVTYVIFITENDVLKGKRPLYTIERTVQETGELFNDRAHIRYVNGSYRGEDEIGKLMHDFHCENYRDMFIEPLADRVKFYKEEPEGVVEMCEAMERIIEKRSEEIKINDRMEIGGRHQVITLIF